MSQPGGAERPSPGVDDSHQPSVHHVQDSGHSGSQEFSRVGVFSIVFLRHLSPFLAVRSSGCRSSLSRGASSEF